MLTAVIYQTGDCGLVSTDYLDELITKAEIKQFLRLEGWITIGCGQLREREKEGYTHDKRQQYLPCYSKDLLAIKLNV